MHLWCSGECHVISDSLELCRGRVLKPTATTEIVGSSCSYTKEQLYLPFDIYLLNDKSGGLIHCNILGILVDTSGDNYSSRSGKSIYVKTRR